MARYWLAGLIVLKADTLVKLEAQSAVGELWLL